MNFQCRYKCNFYSKSGNAVKLVAVHKKKFAYRKPVNLACLGGISEQSAIRGASLRLGHSRGARARQTRDRRHAKGLRNGRPLCAVTVEAIGVTGGSHFESLVWVQSHRCICATKSSFISDFQFFSFSKSMPGVKTGLNFLFFFGCAPGEHPLRATKWRWCQNFFFS